MKIGDRARTGPSGWTLIAGLVALAGVGWAALPFFRLLILGAASCRSPDERPICDSSNQTLVVLLPPAALVLGLLVAGIGGGLAVRRQRSSAPWQIGAWLLVLVAGSVSCSIATAEQSPGYQRQQAEREARERAEWRQELTARPDYEVMRDRFAQMQRRIQVELHTALPGVHWPLLLDDRLGICGSGDGPRAKRIDDIDESDANLTDAQWTALDAVVRHIALDYGFTGPPLRLRPAHAPTGFELHSPDQAHLRVYATGSNRMTITFESACYLPTAERTHLPATTVTSATR